MTTPVIVPVVVDAHVLNPASTKSLNEPPVRWSSDVAAPQNHRVPDTTAPTSPDKLDQRHYGVYLQWRLPAALRRRRGVPDPDDPVRLGHPDTRGFPLIPTRWLVLRYHRPASAPHQARQVTGWIVRSDHLGDELDDDFSTPVRVLHPTNTTEESHGFPPTPYPDVTYLGQARRLPASAAKEDQAPFLTALGTGVPTFAEFQPHNHNVLSLHDPVPPSELAEKTVYRLSYLVVGWYPCAEDDIITSPPGSTQSLAARLTELGWALPAMPDDTVADRTLYSGTVLGLTWCRSLQDGNGQTVPPPPSNMPERGEVTLSIGQSALTSATAALRAPSRTAGGETGTDGEPDEGTAVSRAAFIAFLHGLLLHDQDEPETAAALHGVEHSLLFRPSAAGHRWRAVPATDAGPDEHDRERERLLLDILNHDQHRHDTQVLRCQDVLHRLHDAWVLAARPHSTQKDYQKLLATDDPASLTSAARRELRTLLGADGRGGLRGQIPWAATPEDLATSAARYAALHGWPAGRRLVRDELPPFHRGDNATLTLHGLNGDHPPRTPNPLPCRTLRNLIPGLPGVSAGPPPTTPAITDLPDLVRHSLPALVREFHLLDHIEPTTLLDRLIAGAVLPGPMRQRPPFLRRWRQPWQPLLVAWKITCAPIPYWAPVSPTQECWTFHEGQYSWNGKGTTTEPPETTWKGRTVTGLSYLDPVFTDTVTGRAHQLAAAHPDHATPYQALAHAAADWGQLSIPLDGLDEWMRRRTPGLPLRPDPNHPHDTGKLLGALLAGVPVPDSPELDQPGYQPVRAGQFYFTELKVLDRFGRQLVITDSSNALGHRQFFRAPELVPHPDHVCVDHDPDLVAQLPPRLTRPARLRLDYVDARDDRIVIDTAAAHDPGRSPVCGWIMLSRLGRSLLVYDPRGRGLGELHTVHHAKGPRTTWSPLPDSPLPDLGTAPPDAYPHLLPLLRELRNRPGDTLIRLLAYLEDRLAGISTSQPPTGDHRGLLALVGRPMALLRARLRLELDGPHPVDPANPTHLAAPPTDPSPARWHVQLGDPGDPGDGLLGYLTDNRHFFHSRVPRATYPALTTGPGDHGGDDEFLRSSSGRDLPQAAHPLTSEPLSDLGHGVLFGTDTHLTLLTDPYSAVHAITEILPTTRLAMPGPYLAAALVPLRACFPLGPLLAPVTADHQFAVPCPTLTGLRTFATPPHPERDPDLGAGWETHSLTPPTPATAYSTPPANAHTGYLTITLTPPEPPHAPGIGTGQT